MTKLEYDFVKLSEELSEMQKEVAKCLRFGPHDVGPENLSSNLERLREEAKDVLFMMEELNISTSLSFQDFEPRLAKHRHYKNYSMQRGIIKDEV